MSACSAVGWPRSKLIEKVSVHDCLSMVDTISVSSNFRGVKHITISMPDDLAWRVRGLAAQADTSMAQYLCRLAAEKAVAEDTYTAAMAR